MSASWQGFTGKHRLAHYECPRVEAEREAKQGPYPVPDLNVKLAQAKQFLKGVKDEL